MSYFFAFLSSQCEIRVSCRPKDASNGVLAEFQYQSESDLRAWIARHFKAQGKEISTELSNYLLGQCGLSMTRLHGEISKICSYSGAQTIVRADIDAVVEAVAECEKEYGDS